MKILKHIFIYAALLWLGTALIVLGFDVFLNINPDLCIGILTLILTAIIAISNKHNILQVIMDLVISFIIALVVVWGLGFVWAFVLEFGTTVLSGPLYLVVVFTIATIASISKNSKKKASQ